MKLNVLSATLEQVDDRAVDIVHVPSPQSLSHALDVDAFGACALAVRGDTKITVFHVLQLNYLKMCFKRKSKVSSDVIINVCA